MFRYLQLHIHLCHLKPAPAPALVAVPRPRLFSPKLQGGKAGRLSSSSLSFSSTTADGVPRPWSGLHSWRKGPLNENRTWGADGPQHSTLDFSSSNSTYGSADPALDAVSSLAEFGAVVLSTPDPMAKARVSHVAFARWLRREVPVGEFRQPDRPARPSKPLLVSMRDVPAPKNSGLPLNAYMLHNLAHVELNAIDLAWDTVVRFSPLRDSLGEQFFSDFAHVADEESRHFSWCAQRLAELGFSYGDMPAHDLLWNACERSSQDVAARLAVIPLVQEARGLDAGPRLVQKLMGFGDHRSAKIVAKIAEEEVAHVAVGVFWFLAICKRMGRTPAATFQGLLKEFNVEPKGPFNYLARDEAGIPREWYDRISSGRSIPDLSQVHDRLSSIIAMEKANSSLKD